MNAILPSFLSDITVYIREKLIYCDITDEQICSKSLGEIAFAQEYGFFMPKKEVRKFAEIKDIVEEYRGSIFGVIIVFKSVKYHIFLILIRLQQALLRRKTQQK